MCGICGITDSIPLALEQTVHALSMVNHRGHETAGLGFMSEAGLPVRYIGAGPAREACHVNQLGFRNFSEQFEKLKPTAFIGQTRYSTVGPSTVENGQPMLMQHPVFGPFFLAHNGQLPNHRLLRKRLEDKGERFTTQSDTEVLASEIAHSPFASLPEAVADVMLRLEGAFSIVALSQDHLVGARDRHGVWPLWYARYGNGLILSSERPGLGLGVDAFPLMPGEIVAADRLRGEVCTEQVCTPQPHGCWLNVAYASRPDSYIGLTTMSHVRYALGEELARLCPVKADLVVGVPDSGIDAAAGYAETAGILHERRALVRNRFAPGRSFILPGQTMRQETVKQKLAVCERLVNGKRVTVIDDSVIRSNTSRIVTAMLRQAGAREVHWRIASPPVKYPCYYGIDMPSCEELVAFSRSPAETARFIEADSLQYLPVDAMVRVLNMFQEGWCLGCLTGQYAIPIH